MCVLSRRLRGVFSRVTGLDLDDFPISHCVNKTYGVERFLTFVTFVNNVLQARQCEYLTRFRLGVGPEFTTRYTRSCNAYHGGCKTECLPDLRSMQISAWIAVPLSCCGLRELDLHMHVKEQGHTQLPAEIFTCETLEVLKLDVNLGLESLDQAYFIPSFRLPKLKLLHLSASLISEDGFVTKLVSSCPLLEDLTVKAWWNTVNVPTISSPSIQRLCLSINKFEPSDSSGFVHIDTPNLEYLQYYDNLKLQYSITYMPHLVKAELDVYESSYQQIISLIKSLSNAQQLKLLGLFPKVLNVDNLKHDLPVFPSLKCLELVINVRGFWGDTLLAFLSHSPILETLVFPSGIVEGANYLDETQLDEERRFFRTTLSRIPRCCLFHLKKIVIEPFFGKTREVEWVGFLLRHALVLKELEIRRFKNHDSSYQVADQIELDSTLRNLPRSSFNCSITVQ